MLPQLGGRVAVNAASTTNGATSTGVIDRLTPAGLAEFVMVDVIATTADVVSNAPSVLKLQESDTTDATNFADVVGFRGGTDFTIPNAVTAATAVIQNHYRFNVDARARKRYLRTVVSPRTTQSLTVLASFGRLDEAPRSAAKANVLALVEG